MYYESQLNDQPGTAPATVTPAANDNSTGTTDVAMETKAGLEPTRNSIRYVASLSLFAGADTGRFALEFYLQQHNLLDSLVACVAFEKSATVLECLRRIWSAENRPFPNTPEPVLVHDVLDWLVDGGHPLRTFAERLPYKCIVVITIGSPCQDFNFLARGKGKLGFFGARSILVFTAGLYIFILQKLRPDLALVPVLENGGRMDPHFVSDMPRIVGLNRNKWLQVDVKDAFSCFPRKRYIGSPYQGVSNRQQWLGHAEQACEEGWFFPEEPATFMLPRPYEQGDPDPERFPLPTFTQSHPKHLMKSAQNTWSEILAQCQFEAEVHESLQFVIHNYGSKQVTRREFDDKARPWARHVAVHGRSFGLRFPSGDERLKHVGLPFTVRALQSEREKYALAGNAFHYLEIVSAFGVGEDCLANLIRGAAPPKSVLPLSPQALVDLYKRSLEAADLAKEVSPWAHATPFPYCTEYNTMAEDRWSALIVDESEFGESVHRRRHLDLRVVSSSPGLTSCRVPQTNHGFGSLFHEVARYKPSMWVGPHPDTMVFSTNQAISLLALQLLHRKTNTPHPVHVARLISYLEDKYKFATRRNIHEIQQDWNLLLKGCREEQLDAILVFQGDISEDSFALNTRTDPVVLHGNRSKNEDDKRTQKYEVFAAALHQREDNLGQDPEQEEEDFAVSLLSPIQPLMGMKLAVPQPTYKPRAAKSHHAELFKALYRWHLVCLPLPDIPDLDPAAALFMALWGDSALYKWKRFIAEHGNSRKFLLSQELFHLDPFERLRVVVSSLHRGAGETTKFILYNVTKAEGSALQIESNELVTESHVAILCFADHCQIWTSLPSSVRTDTLNAVLRTFGAVPALRVGPGVRYNFEAGNGTQATLNFVEKALIARS